MVDDGAEGLLMGGSHEIVVVDSLIDDDDNDVDVDLSLSSYELVRSYSTKIKRANHN